jgi:hypothetical protein
VRLQGCAGQRATLAAIHALTIYYTCTPAVPVGERHLVVRI